MVVDDLFPFDPYKEQWAFSRTNQNEIWVLLLEKAWAKVFGSYQRIEVGNTGEALPVLTGAPTLEFDHRQFRWNYNELWDIIMEGEENDYIMNCAAVSEN